MIKERDNLSKKYVKRQTKRTPPDDYYGMFNYSCKNEVRRVLQNSTNQEALNYLSMAKSELENCESYQNIWSGLVQKLNDYQVSLQV